MKQTMNILGLEVNVQLSGAQTGGKYFIFEGTVPSGRPDMKKVADIFKRYEISL